MQIFASHAIAGVVGNILTGVFAQASVAAFDGTTNIPGGWLDRHWAQVGIQLANSVAGMVYSFAVTVCNLILYGYFKTTDLSSHWQTLILHLMGLIPSLRLCSNDSIQHDGIDGCEMGEFAYDYVAQEREIELMQEN